VVDRDILVGLGFFRSKDDFWGNREVWLQPQDNLWVFYSGTTLFPPVLGSSVGGRPGYNEFNGAHLSNIEFLQQYKRIYTGMVLTSVSIESPYFEQALFDKPATLD